MNPIALVFGVIAAGLIVAPVAAADPAPGDVTFVRTQTPDMTCAVASADDDPGIGPNVVCQTGGPQGFPQSAQLHQAVITADGGLSYRDANLGVGGDDYRPDVLVDGETYRIQGWTVITSGTGVTFLNDATGNGAVVDAGKYISRR